MLADADHHLRNVAASEDRMAHLEELQISYQEGPCITAFEDKVLVAATDMLELADPPTAIFAGSDMQAMGVYEAARLHRLRIPDDLSVVGFDDLPMSGWVSPPLTTIIQPLARMAAMATRTVLALLDGRTDTSSNRVELTTSLVVRASTAPPRRKAAVPAGARPARGRGVRSS